MPEADSTRKRSRSPSDSESYTKQSKRPNTGNNSDDSKHITTTTTDSTKNDNDASSPKNGEASATPAVGTIHMRCLIVTQDASIIIGKAGAHVNEIREKSGARVVVSESMPGNPERILNVSGPLDAVSKAFGLIVRRINDEPFDVPSVSGSRAVTIKFMIPNSRMGSVIGKGGSKIKEIQDASGARLNASEGMLPGSTERVLSVAGVADAIHIATYYVGNILIEAQERAPSSSNSSYRPSTTSSSRDRDRDRSSRDRRPPNSSSSSSQPSSSNNPSSSSTSAPGGQLTQEIYIPNDLVGCIIGKGGSKINEIRHQSASQIKIMEPGAIGTANGGPNERLVVITGSQSNIQMAIQLLYTRLEQEKQKQMRAQS